MRAAGDFQTAIEVKMIKSRIISFYELCEKHKQEIAFVILVFTAVGAVLCVWIDILKWSAVIPVIILGGGVIVILMRSILFILYFLCTFRDL